MTLSSTSNRPSRRDEGASRQPWSPGHVHSQEAACGESLTWTLKRNCALTPRELAGAYGLMCGFSLLVGLGFAWAGFNFILGFAVIELLAVGTAMLVWARHATDGEVVTLCNNVICVQRCTGPRVDVVEMPAAWVRVKAESRSVALRTGTQRILVGAQAHRASRAAFAAELRQALRAPLPQSI